MQQWEGKSSSSEGGNLRLTEVHLDVPGGCEHSDACSRVIFVYFPGMFTYMKDSRCHWFSSWKCDNYSAFQLVGTVSFKSAACSCSPGPRGSVGEPGWCNFNPEGHRNLN